MKTSKTTFFRFFKNNIFLLLLPAVSLLFFYPIFLGKTPLPGDFVLKLYSPWSDHVWNGYPKSTPIKNPIMADVVSFTYPMQTLAIQEMKSGRWPLWNPYIFGGTPLLANFQSAPFTITNIVYIFSNNVDAWSVKIVLQHVIASIFTYLLLRNWKVSKIGSIGASIFFAFSGFNLIWSQWNAHTLAAAFIPFILLFEDRLLKKGKGYNGALYSLGICLQIFSGYPQVVIYTFGAMGLLWICHIKKSKEFFVRTLLLLLFTLIGLFAASCMILPAKELLSLSQRSVEPHPYSWAFLPVSKIITFIAPNYFGNHATSDWWGPQDYTSNTGFVGVVVISFAILGLFVKKKEKLFLVSLLIFSLLLSFPTFLSIFLWRSAILGLQAASAHRALVLENLSFALLSGFGIDFAIKSKSKIYLSVLPPFGVAVLYLVLSFLPDYSTHAWIAFKNLLIPFGLLFATFISFYVASRVKKHKEVLISSVILLGILDLFIFGWTITPFVDKSLVFPKTPALSYFESLDMPYRTTGSHIIPINLRMNYAIPSLEGYDAIYPEVYAKLLTVINGGDPNSISLGRYGFVNDDTSKLLDLVNVKYVLTTKETDEKIDKKFLVSKYNEIKTTEPKLVILENTNALERSVMYYDWVIKNHEESLSALPNLNIKSQLILEEAPNIKAHKTGDYSINYIENTPTKVSMRVTTTNDGMLFTSDTNFEGWNAYVDNDKTKVIAANYAFRSIPLKKGIHLVTYRYEPSSFKTGLKITLLSISFLLFICFLPLLKRCISS